MKNEIVSIVVPTFNAGLYIDECLESLICQTYENIEIVVVNDGSTDNTKNIVEEFVNKDKRIRLINTENRGVSSARNIGMKARSKQGFFMFIDADDRMMPTAIEDLKKILDMYDADIVDGYSVTGKYGERKDKYIPSERIIKIWDGEQTIKKCLSDAPEISSCWAKLYRKKIIKNVFFDEDIRVHEDRFFIFKCALEKPKFVSANEFIYQYNNTPNSASKSSFSEKWFDILDVAEREKNIINDTFPHLAKWVCLNDLKMHMILLRLLSKNFNFKYYNIEKKCLKLFKENKKYFISSRRGDNEWFKILSYKLYYLVKLRNWLKFILHKQRKK